VILDADGIPLDPLDRAMHRMSAAVNESIFGSPPDRRVALLRESVTGEKPPHDQIRGLAAWLPTEPQDVYTPAAGFWTAMNLGVK